MDSFEWNKIAGAVLFALLLGVGLTIFSDVLFETEAPEPPGFVVAVATQEGSMDAAGAAPAASQPIGALLALADPQAGAASARKCGACHNFVQGGPNGVGPNLYNVVNRPIASEPGYDYDEAMTAYAETAGTWTFEHLNTFLTNPKGTVPGTKMAFPGLKDDKERANVIAYLRSLSPDPVPLPEAAAVETQPATQVASAEPGAPAVAEALAAAAPAPAPEAETAAPAPAAAAPSAPAAEPQAEAAAPEPASAEPPAAAPQVVAQAEAPAAAPAEAPAAAPAPAAAGAPAAGDPVKGATFAKRCAACHNFENGGPNVVGPNLFDVVNRAIAAHGDFNYSDAMKTFGAGKTWDEATLDAFLANPKGTVPGTKMAFPGVKSEADRANVIAYLKTLAP